MSLNESIVEDAALTWFGELGYAVGFGPHHAPQTGQRESALFQSDAKPQRLPRQRDIRRALIEADLVDTSLRDSAFPQSKSTPQVLSKAKSNMVTLPGQLFYSTQNPVCLWFLEKMHTLRKWKHFAHSTSARTNTLSDDAD